MGRVLPSVVSLLVLISSLACSGSNESPPERIAEPQGLASIRALLEEDAAAAETRAQELLEATEAELGKDSLEVAVVLDVLVKARWRAGKTDETTVSLARRAIAIKTEHLGDHHPELAPSLRNLGETLRLAGEYEGALRHYERALAIKERELEEDDPELATYVYSVAAALRPLGRFTEARPYYERALAILLEMTDPDPLRVAIARNGVGVLSWETGDYARARSEFERVLEIRIRTSGPDHIWVASAHNNLGRLLVDTGDYESASSHYERALAIRELRVDPGHPLIAQSLHNLGTLLVTMGNYEKAQPLLKRALEIRVERYGETDTRVANTLTSLARLFSETGDLEQAESLHGRAIGILREFDPNHPEYAWNLQGLGTIREERGDLSGALEIYREVLTVREATLGERHPFIAETASHLSRTLARTGDGEQAFAQALRAEQLSREHLMLTARTLPEREALRYAEVRSSGLDVALSLVTVEPAPTRVEKAWDALVRSRALVLDEMAARRRAAVRPDSSEITALHDELNQATWELAKLTVQAGAGEDYRDQWDQARHRRERAERELAEHSRPFREELNDRQVDLDSVAERLPSGTALVGFVLYGHYDLDAERGKPTPSYLAFVLRSGEPRLVAEPLGSADTIDRAVLRWKAEAAEGSRQAGRSRSQAEAAYVIAATELRDLVWDPLQPHLEGAETVFIVPDATLNLVGFYALPDDDGRFLIETNVVVHHLAAERDLARFDDPRKGGVGLLALGGPDFESKDQFSALSGGKIAAGQGGAGADGVFRGERSACSDFSTIRFEQLPQAGREADEIARLWTSYSKHGATRLAGAGATEAAFKHQAPGRQIVHLATHGFFLGSGCATAMRVSRGIGGLSAAGGDEGRRTVENPLLLSGLALAGANHRDAAIGDEEDGILTAEEIAAMDLSTVEWAVLSACDTGVGEIQAGEGVFGLRRAFQVAGTATTIMSLWSVEDAATRAWMRALYEARLKEGLDSAQAVREASLRLLTESRKTGAGSHPFRWGGWVAAGDHR